MKEINRTYSSLIAVLLAVGLLLSLAVMLVSADSELPPRPPVPETHVAVRGGTIMLVVSDTQVISDGTHTTVEWLNGFNEWETVDGWRGTFGSSREIVWWVAPEHMGQTNYRWLVFDASDNLLGVSAEFDLPMHSWEPMKIWVEWETDQ